MPYINVNISKKLNDDQKNVLKTKLGELISILPGKSEEVLMIGINDDYTLYFSGKKGDIAFVEVKLFKQSEFEHKAEFTKECFKLFEKEYGVDGNHLFFNISEYETWGFRGVLKK